MIVLAILAGWFGLLALAWALCRVAHDSDEALEQMHPVDWQWPS